MPELPEVEVVRRGLSQLIIGQKILSIEVIDSPKSYKGSPADTKNFVVNSRITDIKRRGKLLIIHLDTAYSLVIHLKMTGQLVFVGDRDKGLRFGAGHPSKGLVDDLPNNSTRVIIRLENGKIFFNDQRKFGWIDLRHSGRIDQINLYKNMGPEPFDTSAEIFIDNLKRRKKSRIKPAILDQKIIAGVGNIYADESLWMSKIHPETRVENISEAKLKTLFSNIVNVLKTSIDHGGSTDKNYVDAYGKKGSYLKFAQVFRRDGLPCPRCGTIITKTKVGGRGTHYCQKCQILYEQN